MRVARRKERKARVGFQHRVTKDDTMAWFKQRFDGIILVGIRLSSRDRIDVRGFLEINVYSVLAFSRSSLGEEHHYVCMALYD